MSYESTRGGINASSGRTMISWEGEEYYSIILTEVLNISCGYY